MKKESLVEVEICSFPAELLCQDLWQLPPACVQVQRRQGIGLPKIDFLQVREKPRVLGIVAAGEQPWSGGCGSRLGRRVWRERREEKVGGNWQRERKQRRIVSSVQGDMCAIPAVSPMTGTELSLSD